MKNNENTTPVASVETETAVKQPVYRRKPIVILLSILLALLIAASLSWCLFGRAIKNVYNQYKLPLSVVMALSLVYCAVTAVL